jgi:hypothetical protein
MLKLSAALLLSLGLGLISNLGLVASAAIVEAAKKEGEVVWYGGIWDLCQTWGG